MNTSFRPSRDLRKSEVAEARSLAQEQLLNSFDQEVVEKVHIEAGKPRNRFEELLWKVTLFYLQPYARFDRAGHSFVLERNLFPDEAIHPGPYRMGRDVSAKKSKFELRNKNQRPIL